MEELNIKPKYWKDLLDDTPFTRKDIIHLQDPLNLQVHSPLYGFKMHVVACMSTLVHWVPFARNGILAAIKMLDSAWRNKRGSWGDAGEEPGEF